MSRERALKAINANACKNSDDNKQKQKEGDKTSKNEHVKTEQEAVKAETISRAQDSLNLHEKNSKMPNRRVEFEIDSDLDDGFPPLSLVSCETKSNLSEPFAISKEIGKGIKIVVSLASKSANVTEPHETSYKEDLSFEVDFSQPGSSFAQRGRSGAVQRVTTTDKKNKRQCVKARTKCKRRKENEGLASAANSDVAVLSNKPLPSNTVSAILSINEDSDCEITGFIPSNSQQNIDPSASNHLTLVLPSDPVSTHTSDVNNTDIRIQSLINTLNETVNRTSNGVIDVVDSSIHDQRIGEQTIILDDEENALDGNLTELDVSQRSRDLIELDVSQNSRLFNSSVNQQTSFEPPVIIVSDDESDVTANTASKLSPEGQVSDKGRKWECPICWEELTSAKGISATVCGHIFCKPCITKIMKSSKKCPKCRYRLHKGKVHPLFLDHQ